MSKMGELYQEMRENGGHLKKNPLTTPPAAPAPPTEPVASPTTAPLTKEEKREKTIRERNALIRAVLAWKPGEIHTPSEYWQACFAATYIAGDFAQHDGIVRTFCDESTRHNVLKTVSDKDKFPHGLDSVKEARITDTGRFLRLVDNINLYAVNRRMAQVPALKLLGLFSDKKERECFRDHIKKHIDTGHPPFPLDELPEREFRKKGGRKA